MDVAVVVEEVQGKAKIMGVNPDYFVANATVSANGLTIRGVGEHDDQDAAEALAIADLKVRYLEAFPPKKIVITKTVSINL
jgi:hypothetical protein